MYSVVLPTSIPLFLWMRNVKLKQISFGVVLYIHFMIQPAAGKAALALVLLRGAFLCFFRSYVPFAGTREQYNAEVALKVKIQAAAELEAGQSG